MFSIDGLASGLDTTSLINQILNLERRPIALIQGQVETATNKQSAYLDLSARLLALQISANRLTDENFFSQVQAESTQPDLLSVSVGNSTPPGSYSFRSIQTARASQFTSSGFAARDALVGAGTMTFEFGGFVDVDTDLDQLNGGQGVARGAIRITDASGSSATIDLSTAINVDDVIAAIEGSNVAVSARISDSGRGLTLEDTSGGSGSMVVEDLDGRTTALDLGIRGTAVGTTLTGNQVYRLGDSLLLSELRDGLGVRTGPSGDLDITKRDGTSVTVDLSQVTTVQGLIDAVSAADADLTLSINSEGDRFDLADASAGGGPLVVANATGSQAASDLGLVGSSTAGTITGSATLAGLNDRLLANLNGGAGVSAGSIEVTDRSGVTTVIDLSAAETLQEVMRQINDSGAAVTASLNRQGNGLRISDTSGGFGSLSIAEVGAGTTASELGLLGSTVGTELSGGDLNLRYFDENTRLDSLNGGSGVAAGSIRLTDSNGVSFTVDLSQESTLQDVILDITGAAASAGSDVTVSINATGNGLLLSSLSGSSDLRVEEVDGGRTARDLGILGVSDASQPGIIDGSFEHTITIEATDTLEDLRDRISELGIPVTASILNDGSSGTPFRLSVVGAATGAAARLQIDVSGSTALNFQQTATARDGILFYGEDSDGSSSLMIRSATNTYEDVVQGMTVTATGTSSQTIGINVTRDQQAITDQVNDLVTALNEVLDQIGRLTDFNLETETSGILLGDSTIRNVQRSLIRAMTRPLGDDIANQFNVMAEVGVRLRGGKFTFDRAQFESALAENPDAVQRLFGAARTISETTSLDEFENGEGVRRATGQNDIRFELRDGNEFEVNLDSAINVGDVISQINAAAAGSLIAELSTDGRSIVLRDQTSGTNTFRVTSINSSGTANDLGISRTADSDGGGMITGGAIDLDRDPGVAARLDDAITSLTDATDGVLQRRADGLDDLIETLNERIERIEERLVNREEILRRQFANLELIMAESQATMDRLNASLLGLS